jgi:hypothetical protein
MMKRKAIKATVLAAMISAQAGEAGAEDYRKNPFTLTYADAITKNEPGKVNIHAVTYKLKGLDISANVYTRSCSRSTGPHISKPTGFRSMWTPRWTN